MILETHAELNATLRTVFTVFAGFWIGVLVVLYLGTGWLLKRAEKASHQPPAGKDAHH